MNIINRAERVGATQGNQRERSYKRQATLERAQTFLKTGKLPGKDNSIAAQRSMRQAKERLAAKNTARKRAAASQQSLTQGRQARAAANFTRATAAKPLPGNRRLTKPQVRSQLRTESAMKISKGGEAGAKEIRNARGLARTSKARNNQLQTRAQRLENAQRSGNPLITVSGSVKPATRKVDLSASAFSRRAKVAEARANSAGRAVRGLDRANPSNRKAFAKADALQAASDRYSSIVRKSRGGEFTAAQVFQGMNTKRSTVPTRSEKAAKTRADKKLKALEANIKAAERARRIG
jgi:demethoxyubiquinone hydroxylase (CLK1/Coq7/Cat5 family)